MVMDKLCRCVDVAGNKCALAISCSTMPFKLRHPETACHQVLSLPHSEWAISIATHSQLEDLSSRNGAVYEVPDTVTQAHHEESILDVELVLCSGHEIMACLACCWSEKKSKRHAQLFMPRPPPSSLSFPIHAG